MTYNTKTSQDRSGLSSVWIMCLMPLSEYFSYVFEVNFIDWGSSLRNPQTFSKSLGWYHYLIDLGSTWINLQTFSKSLRRYHYVQMLLTVLVIGLIEQVSGHSNRLFTKYFVKMIFFYVRKRPCLKKIDTKCYRSYNMSIRQVKCWDTYMMADISIRTVML